MADKKITFIMCGRTGERCSCGAKAERLCSYELRGRMAGKMCGSHLCLGCSMLVAKDKAYCMPHYRVSGAKQYLVK